MTKNMNFRRKEQAVTNRQLHVVLSLVGSGLDLMDESFCPDARSRGAVESIGRWRQKALDNLPQMNSVRAEKAVAATFAQVKDVIIDRFPDHDFGAEEWMHYWLAAHMMICDALITKVQTGGKSPWRYMERSSLALVKFLAGDKEHELYEIGSVNDTEPLLGTAVGEALTDIIWSE